MIFCKNHPKIRASNIKYELCSDCNHLRIHGESKFDTAKAKHIKYKERESKRPKVIRIVKKTIKKPIRITKQQSEINIKYIETCKKIDSTRDQVCSGCGYNQALSHSHIISRDDCRKMGRLDLIYDENNITFHCMDMGEHIGCHRLWETKVIQVMGKLKDFKKNMDYIKSINMELYARIVNRGTDY